MRSHRSHVRWRHAGLHQHTSHWPRRRHGPACSLYRADPWLDGQQSPEAERGEDADRLARYTSAAEQSNGPSFDSSQRHCRVFNHCQGPRRCVGQSAHHGRPHRCTQPIVLLLHPAAQVDKTVIDTRRSEDTGVRFCQQSHRLLQQHSCWCQWSTATEAAISPECSCTSWSLEPGDPIAWRPFYANCIGYQYASELSSRRPCWYTNVCMAWLRHTCRHLRANVITRRSASPALCWVRPTHCSTYEDKLQRPQFCRLRTSRVEQSSSRTPSAGHFTPSPSVQETTENVPVLG